MSWLGTAWLLVTLLPAVPVAVLAAQVLLARRRPAAPLPSGRRPRLAVLVPAHDESTGLLAPLAAARAQLAPGDRLLVVADNCSDDTAAVAAQAGAEVVERRDRDRRGKGYALDFGVRQLAAAPPEVVVVLDADCVLEPEALARLAACCAATGRPVQACYRMAPPPGAGLGQRLAAFAWRVKNELRPLGMARLGLPCQLMGTGMAFPWGILCSAPLASGHLVEDLQLGLDLAAAGAPPRFLPEAVVQSWFPANQEGARTQRQRWEHGHLQVIAAVGPRLLGRALRRGSLPLLALGLDLLVPPLALLALLVAALAAGNAALWLLAGVAAPLQASLATLAVLAVVLLVAWWRVGRALVAFADLVRIPGYALAKLPVYAAFLRRRQTEWVRSKRDP